MITTYDLFRVVQFKYFKKKKHETRMHIKYKELNTSILNYIFLNDFSLDALIYQLTLNFEIK